MYKPFTIPALDGLNEDENPAAVRQTQLREANNCSRRGVLTGTRPGLVRDIEYDADIGGTPAVQGIHEFRSGRDENRSLVVVAGGEVYVDATTQLGKSSATITSGANNPWTFASYQNLLWAAGGNQSTPDTVWTWDGNPANDVTGRLSGLGIKPNFVFSKFNTLFLGGFHDGTDFWNNPLVGRYVDYATDPTVEANWPNSNAIPGQLLGENRGVGSYGEEFNTGFGSYQDNRGDFLLFLTNRRIIAFSENPNLTSNANRFVQTDAIANGCVSQRAFVDLGYDQGDAVYVSENGVHSLALSNQYGNRENTFLSWPIRKTWATLNRARSKYINAAYWPTEGIVLIAASTGSSTTHNLLLCLDLQGAKQISPDTVRWYKWFLNGVNVNVLKAARDPDGSPRIYVGGTAGEVAPFTRVAYSDLGASIATRFRTKDEDFGAPAVEKSIGDAFLSVAGSGTYTPTHTYVLDDGRRTGKSTPVRLPTGGATFGPTGNGVFGSSKFGSDSKIHRDRIPGVGSGHTVSHQFSHTGAGEPFWVGQIIQDVAGQGIADEAE